MDDFEMQGTFIPLILYLEKYKGNDRSFNYELIIENKNEKKVKYLNSSDTIEIIKGNERVNEIVDNIMNFVSRITNVFSSFFNSMLNI